MLAGLLASLLIGPPTFPTDDPEALLKAKGLKKVVTTYVLDEEAEMSRGFSSVQKLQKDHTQAVAAVKGFEQEQMRLHAQVPELTRRRLQLGEQMQNTPRGSPNYNQVALLYNETTDRLNLIQGQIGESKRSRDMREQVAKKREAFVQALVDLQPRLATIDKKYEELAADPDVAQAIEALNRTAKVRVKLGPSSGFLANHKAFDKTAATLLSDNVPIRPEAGVNMIDVTLNGKLTKAMVLDTGASWVTLPADLAQQAGVNVAPDAAKVKVTIADGTSFEAAHGYLATVRVGQFTVEQVECIVLPAEFKAAPALLGTSFLRSFIFRVNPDSRSLSLSRIEEASGPAKKK